MFFADYAKNISKGGTFIRTSSPLDVGTELLFVLSVPGESASLPLRGEVMWKISEARATEDQPAGMGIRFAFADEGEREALEAFVGRLLTENLGPAVADKLLGKR
jgi:type IV pilus assembly protein PilZ